MTYTVYILFSKDCAKYYVGQTDDIERRLDEHNSGRGGKYTARCKPWGLVYTEHYESRSLAVNRESEIKKKKSRKYLERLIDQNKEGVISSAG